MDRRRVGSLGVFAGPVVGGFGAEDQRRTVRHLEDLGYGALWYGEALGRESLTQGAIYLSASRRIVVASGIASIYGRDPMAAAFGARALNEAWDGRFLLGLGVSHAAPVQARGHRYNQPVTRMREYLAAMDEAEARWAGPPSEPATRVLAALRPNMLALARDCTLGAHPYFITVEHTRRAREILGPGSLLAPEQAVILAAGRQEARARGERHLSRYPPLPNYRNNLRWLGWPEADLGPPVSDALFDALVAWGGVEEVRERVRQHREAGADHVVLNLVGARSADEYRQQAEVLAGV
jgi:probable F420-dependent oxidoreductase